MQLLDPSAITINIIIIIIMIHTHTHLRSFVTYVFQQRQVGGVQTAKSGQVPPVYDSQTVQLVNLLLVLCEQMVGGFRGELVSLVTAVIITHRTMA